MGKSKILVVDDEPFNVELLEGMLSTDYDILTAYNGNEALEQVEKNSPDLILLDIMMPGLNGYEVCRRLKNNDTTISIPVVMVTALTEKKDRIKAIESGADDFLSKPVDQLELKARVKSLLRVKEYYDALMAEKEKLLIFKSALNGMDDCVIITNMSGDIKYVNPIFEKRFGYSLAQVSEKHISLIKHPESSLALDKESIIQDTRHEWKGNLIGVNKHGLKLNMSLKCSPIMKGNHMINRVFVLREIVCLY